MTELELYPGTIYNIPDPPPRKQILGFDLPKADQKWKNVRVSFPEEWKGLSKSELELIPEYETTGVEEDRKCTEGVWFYNNGDSTYVTGHHYHYLSWCKIDTGYPDYRDRDRRWFYHWDYCEKDEECLGQNYGKLRRDGYTYRALSIILNVARKSFNSNFGMVSKTGDDSKKCFSKLISIFLEYPMFFKPQTKAGEDMKKELAFGTPSKRVTHKTREVKKELALNTVIDWKNTSESAYDSTKQKRLLCDEPAKWEEANIEVWYAIGKTTLILGSQIVGKMLFGSTVNEANRGGKGFKVIWKNSDPTERVSNGRTVSGLLRYFVPAYDGLEGFLDQYGMSVIETPSEPVMGLHGKLIRQGAKEYLEAESKAKKDAGDSIGYYEHKRQFPITEADMFRDAVNDETVFDQEKIIQQMDHNTAVFQQTPGLLVQGDFRWNGGVRDTQVDWCPNTQGRWLVYWLPPQDRRNKQTLIYNQKSPGNSHEGLFSLDPYDSTKTVDSRKSDAASHGFRKLDFMQPEMSNIFISEYCCRPGDPFITFEDMIMCCVFYGWPILIEKQKNACLNYMKHRGYGNYIMFTPDHLVAESSKGKDVDPGMSNASPAVRQSLIENYQHYLFNNVGINPSTQKIGNLMFQRTLQDALDFDANNWSPHDLTVSAMLCVAGSKSYTKPPEKSKLKPTDFFKTYSRK